MITCSAPLRTGLQRPCISLPLIGLDKFHYWVFAEIATPILACHYLSIFRNRLWHQRGRFLPASWRQSSAEAKFVNRYVILLVCWGHRGSRSAISSLIGLRSSKYVVFDLRQFFFTSNSQYPWVLEACPWLQSSANLTGSVCPPDFSFMLVSLILLTQW